MIAGLLAIIAFGLRMFGIGDTVITTDKQWLMLFFGGIGLFMIGFLIESYQLKPVSEFYKRRRKQMIRYCWYAILPLVGMITMLLIWQPK